MSMVVVCGGGGMMVVVGVGGRVWLGGHVLSRCVFHVTRCAHCHAHTTYAHTHLPSYPHSQIPIPPHTQFPLASPSHTNPPQHTLPLSSPSHNAPPSPPPPPPRYADAATLRDKLKELEDASAAAQALAAEWGTDAVQPKLRLGQRVMHKTLGYRGVVCGYVLVEGDGCGGGGWGVIVKETMAV